jgi:hypothetical protein
MILFLSKLTYHTKLEALLKWVLRLKWDKVKKKNLWEQVAAFSVKN